MIRKMNEKQLIECMDVVMRHHNLTVVTGADHLKEQLEAIRSMEQDMKFKAIKALVDTDEQASKFNRGPRNKMARKKDKKAWLIHRCEELAAEAPDRPVNYIQDQANDELPTVEQPAGEKRWESYKHSRSVRKLAPGKFIRQVQDRARRSKVIKNQSE